MTQQQLSNLKKGDKLYFPGSKYQYNSAANVFGSMYGNPVIFERMTNEVDSGGYPIIVISGFDGSEYKFSFAWFI